jgi:hypothetical protein
MSNISYSRHRFPPEIIQHAVWLYFRFPLSYRDVEDLLSERGIDVSYETVRRWALKFGRAYAYRLRRSRSRSDARWRRRSSKPVGGGKPVPGGFDSFLLRHFTLSVGCDWRPCHGNIVICRWGKVMSWDEQNLVLKASIPARDRPICRLAVFPVSTQLSRCRGSAGRARH